VDRTYRPLFKPLYQLRPQKPDYSPALAALWKSDVRYARFSRVPFKCALADTEESCGLAIVQHYIIRFWLHRFTSFVFARFLGSLWGLHYPVFGLALGLGRNHLGCRGVADPVSSTSEGEK
jgi:hypothetical protein